MCNGLLIMGKIAQDTPNKPRKLTVNQVAYLSLKEQGLTPRGASMELGLSHNYGYYTDKKLDKKYSLCDPRLAKKARKTIVSLMQGEPVGTIETVKDSTALRAAELIYDRYEPAIKQQDTSPVNIYNVLQSAHTLLFHPVDNPTVDNPILPLTVDKSDREGG